MPQGLKPGNSDELVWLKGGMVIKDFLLKMVHIRNLLIHLCIQAPFLESTKQMEGAMWKVY